jgi:hypothetical protein
MGSLTLSQSGFLGFVPGDVAAVTSDILQKYDFGAQTGSAEQAGYGQNLF